MTPDSPPRMPFLTLTGVDDATSLDVLLDIDARVPRRWLEWGVLYSTSNAGEERYPSLAKIAAIAKLSALPNAPQFALHVCGRAVRDFIAGAGHVRDIAPAFARVQLNLRADAHDLVALRAAIEDLQPTGQVVITQHNVANAALHTALVGLPNHAVLFDESGGRGTRRAAWPAPLLGVVCGYAGGLGPDNLAQELPRIHAAAAGKPYWVDMESRLRNDAHLFDLGLASACIDAARRFVAA